MNIERPPTLGCKPVSEQEAKVLERYRVIKRNLFHTYAHGSAAGILRGKQKMGSQYGNHAYRVILELSQASRQNFGQQPPKALMYLYMRGWAGIVIEVSEEGDKICVPHMRYIFFAPNDAQSETRQNGWSASFIFNLTLEMSQHRMQHNSPADIAQKANIIAQQEEETDASEPDDTWVL